MNRTSTITVAIALALASTSAWAQDQGHDMSSMPGMVMPKPAPAPAKKAAPKKPVAKPVARPATKPATPAAKPKARGASKAAPMAGMDHSGMSGTDHAAMGHAMPAPATAKKPAKTARKPVAESATKPVAKPAVMPTDHGAMGHGGMAMPAPAAQTGTATDMSGMDHGKMPMPGADAPEAMPGMDMGGMDMSGMDHGKMPMPAAESSRASSGMDHGGMDMGGMDHSQMDMPGMDHGSSMPGMGAPADLPANAAPRTPIPAVTEADRAAAFMPLDAGHAAHDKRTHSYWLVDRLEVADTARSGAFKGIGWVGGDVNRLWLRSEANVSAGRVEQGNVEALFGHSVTPWWDVVAGVRQDVGEGPDRTWAAFGVQGLAPYKFDIEATAYVGGGGRTAARLEAEYDTLLTNRLILQWQGEANVSGRSDAARRLGSGLSTVAAGARLRYEITRRFAPYVGVELERAFGGTARFRRADGFDTTDTRLVAGIRFWF